MRLKQEAWDGSHLTASGYRAWGAAIANAVVNLTAQKTGCACTGGPRAF